MRIEEADIIPIEFQVKSSVPDSELQSALKCVHESTSNETENSVFVFGQE